MEYTTLSNGVSMPMLGYGVYKVDAAECERCVRDAIEVGYRLIDTAQFYANEAEVGRAIKQSGLAREDFFIVTKVWLTSAGQQKAAAAIEASLRNLASDYVDLLLIHQPFNDYYGTWRAMEAAWRDGKARAIGVSNFYPDRLVDLIRFNQIAPMVNQVELHPLYQQPQARQVMQKYKVQPMAWGPFARGRQDMFAQPTLAAIAQRHRHTPAQVILRYLIQQGIAVIPKTTHRGRMAENFQVFDFALSTEDMAAIAAMDTGVSAFYSHYDPQTVEYITGLSS